jgi:proline racemase
MREFADAESRGAAVWDWDPPDGTRRIVTVEAHTEGEPLRVILAGMPELEDATVRARREDALARHDGLRRALMWEPRGHADMYGCVVTPPERPGSDFGVVFMHNDGYSTMCGHGILAVARVAVELGLVSREEPETPVVIDTPAGRVQARVRVEGGRTGTVSFRNVPSWAATMGRNVDVQGLGTVVYDVAFGGAFYAYVDAPTLGFDLVPAETGRLIEAGRAIRAAVAEADPPVHPDGEDLSFLYGTIFVGPAHEAGNHSRNVCVFADGEVDRSPTGTGVSGRLALHHARSEILPGDAIVIESLIGSRFRCRIVETVVHAAGVSIVPEVEGRSFITGRAEWLLDPEDPLAEGFLLR